VKVIALTRAQALTQVWTPEFVEALDGVGEFDLVEHGGDLSDANAAELLRSYDVAIVGWDARPVPEELAASPGQLGYICCYSGTIRAVVPRALVQHGILVSNWGDLPAAGVAEGAVTLLLAVAHQIPRSLRVQQEGGWGFDGSLSTGLRGLAVGVYGYGVIGRRFVEMLRPFGPRLRAFDPYVDVLPEDVEPADSLEELCRWSEALVVHAGLSDETVKSLGRRELALLEDHSIVINTARGDIVDQEALFRELQSGRLRAGLDVLEPDQLAADHPIRSLDNVILTFHAVSHSAWPVRGVDPRHDRVLEQLRRFGRGETPQWLFDTDRYDRST
jgi:phosphoglycerate dehydrogenase-like enzyme